MCFFRPTNARQTLGAAQPIAPSGGYVDDSSGTGHHTDGGGTAPPREWKEALPGGPPQVVDIRTPSGRASHERHTRKRRRCRRKGKQDMVFYLNLQGGRKEAKWEELFLLLQKENVTVACLTETHLRDEETPPPNRQFVWSGLNRTKGERKGGGLGFLTKVDTQWDRVQRDCEEHMWLTGEIGGVEIALGLVYLWTGREVHQRNTETLACLEKDITQINRPVVVVGDFNAHIEALDGTTDRAGRLLLEWTERLGLTLLNATEKCMGRITWAVRGMSSCIDYCFLSPVLLPKLSYMSIDSTGERSLGSDHHSIFLSFGTNPPETKRDAHAGNLQV